MCVHVFGQEKFLAFKQLSRTYGRTALLLSGGAALGMYHIGVVKALYEANLLPKVWTGSGPRPPPLLHHYINMEALTRVGRRKTPLF